MAERMLITKLVRTNGTRADLYAKGHRWPDLKLFDLSDLLAVEIDPTDLEMGQEVPCRFWALWELSDKTNQAGNRYKDVLALEPMDKPATSTSTDTMALLAELRAIRSMLEIIAGSQGQQVSGAREFDQAFPRYGDGSTVSDNPAEVDYHSAYLEAEGQPPSSVEALRAWALVRKNQSR